MSFLTSREKLAPQGIGKSLPRREAMRLLTGCGRYANDFSLPGQAHAYLVRSPYAHASIVRVDVAQASGSPGVLAGLTPTCTAPTSISASHVSDFRKSGPADVVGSRCEPFIGFVRVVRQDTHPLELRGVPVAAAAAGHAGDGSVT